MERRVFVRIDCLFPIKLDIEEIFIQFGSIETAYTVESSHTKKYGKYSMIGYVLYYDKVVAQKLISLKKFTHGKYTFTMKKVRPRVDQNHLRKRDSARKERLNLDNSNRASRNHPQSLKETPVPYFRQALNKSILNQKVRSHWLAEAEKLLSLSREQFQSMKPTHSRYFIYRDIH